MEKLISESAFYEAIYKLPIREKKADGENLYFLVSIADIFEMLERLPANNSEIPNSSDTISRQAAIEAVMECYDNDELFEVYEDKLRELPPAQPQRIRGHWIPVGGALYQCDQCGVVSLKRKFCSECGADMREVTE